MYRVLLYHDWIHLGNRYATCFNFSIARDGVRNWSWLIAVNNDHKEFLNLLRLPGTIDAGQAAILLGIAEASVSILVAKLFLKLLGKQLAANAPKRFSSAAIEALARNPDEMSRMHHLITSHWRAKNGTSARGSAGVLKQSRN